MSDSDDEEEGEGGSRGVSLTGFLFGNIDMKTGQLEDDILDQESKRQLSALQKLGLGSMMNDVMDDDDHHHQPTKGDGGKEEEKSSSSLRRLIGSYDSSDSEEESMGQEESGEKGEGGPEGQNKEGGNREEGQVDDEDYDEEKSPSAVDFSDISELAEEDPLTTNTIPSPSNSTSSTSSVQSMTSILRSAAADSLRRLDGEEEDDTDYDADSDAESLKNKGEGPAVGPKHVRRLFTTNDDKFLMPPPLASGTPPKKVRKNLMKMNGDGEIVEDNGDEEEGRRMDDDDDDSSSDNNEESTPEEDDKSDKKLETPLAAMMPSKYAGVDVSEIFPDFRTGKVLRFARLFGPGKPSSLPQIWRNVKRRRRKRKILSEGLSAADLAEERERRGWEFFFGFGQYSEDEDTDNGGGFHDDDEDRLQAHINFMNRGKDWEEMKALGHHANIWRRGPAELWYDMLNVPEDGDNFDYGFQIQPKKKGEKNEVEDWSTTDEEEEEEDRISGSGSRTKKFDKKKREESATSSYPDETFHMVTQRDWESDIIWDGNDTKYKKTTKNKAAGWVPSGVNRTAQNFSPQSKNSTGDQGSPSTSAATAGSPSGGSKKDGATSGSVSKAAAKAAAIAAATLAMRAQEGGLVDDTWYSIFPVETSELVYGRWEDEVIWDVEKMDHIPQPKILALDPNDENVVLCIPDDIDPNAAQGHIVPVKVKIPHPHVKKSKILLGKAGVINVIEEDSPPPSPKNDDKDPYNISNDEYYQPKYTEQSMLKISAAGNIIQHSTPVVELRAPFIPTNMPFSTLRAFHRPSMKYVKVGVFAHPGPHPVLPLTKHIKKKAKQREAERLAAGGGDIFFMRTPDDLTGKDGELLMVEYCEEHPPLLSQVGMCAKIKNYYKRVVGKDEGAPHYKYGETAYAHSSPFLGIMQSGQSIQTLENLMYRAPIYPHPIPFCDFLIIRTKNNYFIREVDGLYTAGQECPLYEVPGPNSKRANNFVRDFLQVFIYRLFWKSRDSPRRIRMEEIKRAFPMHSESSIRKRLKLCADFKRTGVDSNWWVIKPDFRLPTEEEIRAMVSPEQCCAYFSLTSAEQRLKDAGYGEKFLFAPQDDDEDDNQNKIDDEVKTAPWNTTRAYIQAMKGKCLLQLTGPADPTGCGEGFSYVRVPNKPQTNKEEQEAQPKRIVTGTDADLRRLSLNNAKALLRKFMVPEEEIKKLSRWEVIDVVRTLSTEKAKAGEKGMTKFSRGNRFSVAEHQERYKEECQRIFELQHRILSSSEVLSTDEGESSGSELSDLEEMGKNIENIISNKKTNTQVNQEKEEQERRELQKMIMGEGSGASGGGGGMGGAGGGGGGGGKDDEDRSPKKKRKEEEENQTLSGLVNHPGRVLKIHRTFKSADGKEYTRTEIVRKAAIIDIYMRIRTTKDEHFIRQFALLDDQAKEEMKKEKRRIQEQLRRIKRNQEKDTNKPVPPPRKKKVKLKPDLKMKCGACQQVGHMRTNKACPLYAASSSSPIPSMNIAMTQDEEDDMEKHLTFEDEELVRVDGTKVQLSGKVVKHVEDMKRRSLVLKVPKELQLTPTGQPKKKKKRAAQAPHCDYLSNKKGKTTNRRRIDPMVVIGGIFENILNELRELPDSSQFHYPVNLKTFPDYTDRIQKPMDLQSIRENIRQKNYQTTSDFLAHVTLIYENSVVYNGAKSLITEYAHNLLTLCKKRVKEKGDQLEQLERMINPLLDDDQTGLAYILEQCLNKVRTTQEAFPFLKPVNKKAVKDYYDIIKTPMDLETMEKKNKVNKYLNRNEFLADLSIIYTNAIQYNGRESVFATKASQLTGIAADFFQMFEEQLSTLEGNIEKSRANMLEEFGDVGNHLLEEFGEMSPAAVDPEEDGDRIDGGGGGGGDREGVSSGGGLREEDEDDDSDMDDVEMELVALPPSPPFNHPLTAPLDESMITEQVVVAASHHLQQQEQQQQQQEQQMSFDLEQHHQPQSHHEPFSSGEGDTGRNIHEDLEVSESDEEDEEEDGELMDSSKDDEEDEDHRHQPPPPPPPPAQQQQQQQQEQEPPPQQPSPPYGDDDGLWF